MINLTQYLDVVITVKDFFWIHQILSLFSPVHQLCVLSHFSCADSLCPYWLKPSRFLCPWDSPGKNTEQVTIPSSRESSWPRDPTHVSCVFCITEADSLQLSHRGSPETPALTIKTRGFVSPKLTKQWHHFGAIYNRMQCKTDVWEGNWIDMFSVRLG